MRVVDLAAARKKRVATIREDPLMVSDVVQRNLNLVAGNVSRRWRTATSKNYLKAPR
jgi:hypothetical protein